MASEIFTLALQIDPGESVSPDQLFDLTQDLRAEIREVGVQSVEFERADKAPSGAMVFAAITLGALAIAVLPNMLPELIDFLKEWKLRHASSTITIKHQRGDEIVEATLPASVSEEQLGRYMDVLTQQLLKDPESKGRKSK